MSLPSHARTAGLEEAVASVPAWYHTIDLPGGVVTPGYFDLRPIVEALPWPDVRGRRCLDVGTYDGFLAFELERRGAAEVVAIDVADPHDWDWPPDAREAGPKRVVDGLGAAHARGFDVAREALRSSVERRNMTIYELSPETVGRFDVVVCGSLLLHLRDPLRALEAIRGVCDGHFLSSEEIRLALTLLHRRRPIVQLDGSGERVQWWVPNAAGHERMLFAAGFAIERRSAPFVVGFGESHPPRHGGRFAWRNVKGEVARRLLAGGGAGVPHRALLAKPRV